MKNLSNCKCLPDTIGKHEKALSLLIAGPQEENKAEKKSVNMLIATIAKLRFDPGPPACEKFCRQKFGNLMHAAGADTNFPFQGLCLDCINLSTPTSDNVDLDIWSRDSVPPRNGVKKCRLNHIRVTSYFSYMGPEGARYQFSLWMDDAVDEGILEADEEGNFEEEDDPEKYDKVDGENNDQNNDDDEMN